MGIQITTQSVAEHDGVHFVRVIAHGQHHDAGDNRYAAMVEASISMAKAASKESTDLRVVLAEYAIEVQTFGACTVAVAYRLGAPIVKSMKRMMRKLGRKYANQPARASESTARPDGRPSADDLDEQVKSWNSQYQVGIDVRYWPGMREGDFRVGKTTSAATVLGGHSAVVYIEGAGAVALSHVEPPPALAVEPEPTVHS